MQIERIPERLLKWGAIVCGLVAAFVLARMTAQGRLGSVTLVLFLSAAGLGTMIARDRIWILVPAAWGLLGSIPMLEIPFGIRDIITMWVFGAFFAFLAFKLIKHRPKVHFPDLMLGVMILYLFTSFIRNPVGLAAFGSDRVGGRPYFTVAMACLAYWVLIRASLKPSSSGQATLLLTATKMFDGVTAQLLHWIPALIPIFALAYSSDFHDALQGNARVHSLSPFYGESTDRKGYLSAIGYPLLLFLAVRYPLPQLLQVSRPWRPALFVLGSVCVLLSGFRSALLLCAGVFLVAGYFHRGRAHVIGLVSAGVFTYVVLALGNGMLFDLPLSAQRALSWLPGNWSPVAIQDAQGSTEWRKQMWDVMLNTNQYIDNHTWGDGFGFKKRDLERMIWAQTYGAGGGTQEDFMVSGSVHSGPVSAIRYVGYVGLGLHLIILVAIAIEAWKCCRQARGTPFQTMALFVCIPLLIEPLFYTAIFGAFENSVPSSLLGLGMVRMLQNSMNGYTRRTAVPIPQTGDLDFAEFNTSAAVHRGY